MADEGGAAGGAGASTMVRQSRHRCCPVIVVNLSRPTTPPLNPTLRQVADTSIPMCEDAMHLLHVLDYESNFCFPRDTPPFHRYYFALPPPPGIGSGCVIEVFCGATPSYSAITPPLAANPTCAASNSITLCPSRAGC